MSDTGNLLNIIDSLKNVKLLVIGDLMLDSYEYCEVRRISPEAPVPVATVQRVTSFIGGAGNVANNARALGAGISLIGIVGDDKEGSMIARMLTTQGVDNSNILIDKTRPTTHKKRVLANTQQLLRIDRESTDEITGDILKRFLEAIELRIRSSDAVVLSDYCKGIFSEEVIGRINVIASREKKPVFVDSKNQHLLRYAGSFLVKPNREEAERIAGERFNTDFSNLDSIGKKLSKLFRSNLVITLGSDGMALFEGDRFVRKATRAQQVFDVSGAGDTAHAAIAVAVAAGASLEDAVEIANHAAGYVVGRLGTVVCGVAELKQSLSTI